MAAAEWPIACTLSAADMGPRLARIRRLTADHLRAHDLQASTLRLSYAREAGAELSAIVELERECCAFLSFHLSGGRQRGRVAHRRSITAGRRCAVAVLAVPA